MKKLCLSGFPIELKKEASQIKVIYYKYDDVMWSKLPESYDISLHESFEIYNIPLNPGSYTADQIKGTIKRTKSDFGKYRALCLADVNQSVLNHIEKQNNTKFDLKHGENLTISVYEIPNKQKSVEIKDFVHILSHAETLEAHPWFVGINFKDTCK